MNDSYSLLDLEELWQKIKIELEELHRQRKKNVLEETSKKAIHLFMQYLYMSNDKSVSFQEPLSFTDLEIKPVNLKERLEFILARPSLFPSYVQLCELMAEQEKLAAKKRIMKKASNQNG